MTTVDVTRTTATRGLHAAMEARAHNLEQNTLLFNPSVEVDSLGEFPAVLLRYGVPEGLVAQMITLCRQVLESNVAEGECEQGLAGLLETHIARARTSPLMRVTAKTIARQLRDPLTVLLRPADHDGVAFFRAASAVRDIITAVPRDELLASAVAHELSTRKFGLLTRLVADFDGAAA